MKNCSENEIDLLKTRAVLVKSELCELRPVVRASDPPEYALLVVDKKRIRAMAIIVGLDALHVQQIRTLPSVWSRARTAPRWVARVMDRITVKSLGRNPVMKVAE